jgi:hypothetical protein
MNDALCTIARMERISPKDLGLIASWDKLKKCACASDQSGLEEWDSVLFPDIKRETQPVALNKPVA